MAEMPVEQEPDECPCDHKVGYAKGYAAGLERAAVIAESYGDVAGVGDEIAAAIRQEGRDGA